MKYTVDIDIDLPREKVIELFDNPDNMPKWQPELISFQPLSGEPGQKGATSKLIYKMGKREVEMIETITERKLPDVFAGTYETQGVLNINANRFEALSESRTKWISENEFKFSGFMSIMALFMKGSFKKQTGKYLEQFKAFAESSN